MWEPREKERKEYRTRGEEKLSLVRPDVGGSDEKDRRNTNRARYGHDGVGQMIHVTLAAAVGSSAYVLFPRSCGGCTARHTPVRASRQGRVSVSTRRRCEGGVWWQYGWMDDELLQLCGWWGMDCLSVAAG